MSNKYNGYMPEQDNNALHDPKYATLLKQCIKIINEETDKAKTQ